MGVSARSRRLKILPLPSFRAITAYKIILSLSSSLLCAPVLWMVHLLAGLMNLLQKNKERNILLGSLAAIAVITTIIIVALRNNRKKNKLLESQKSIIEKQLQEKEILMREIHHRVKNNLQIISGLLNLQSRHIDDPNALQAVREGRNRVKSIALIHQQLYQQESLTDINFKNYVNDLMHSVQQSFRDNGKQIRHQIECPDMLLDVEVAVLIGLIINELATNSYKYAFPNSKEGTIGIAIRQEGKSLDIHMYDNGIGLPQNFEWQRQKSFGMKMIGTMVNKLKALVQWEHSPGTRVNIHIPDYSNIT